AKLSTTMKRLAPQSRQQDNKREKAQRGSRRIGVPMLKMTAHRSAPVTILIGALLMASCSGGGKGSTDPPPNPDPPQPGPISVTTTSLPNGQMGHAYAATLAATGGKAPLSWAVSAGALPAGLMFASSGAISGTPTATAAATPITFTVSD